MAQFGEKLRQARERKGMTQQALADQIYVTRQSVSRWETGERYPDLLMLKKLSSILEISIDELLADNEMVHYVEKSSVVKNVIINNLMIALYACVVLVFVIQALNALTLFHPIDEIIGGHYFSMFLAGSYLLEAILFIYSFIHLLKKTATPKNTGILISFFFLLEMMPRIESILNRTTTNAMLFALICLLPYVLGAIGGYLYLMNEKHLKLGKYLIYFSSAFEMFVLLLNVWTLISYAPSFLNLTSMLSVLLRFLISLTLSYDTYVFTIRYQQAKRM